MSEITFFAPLVNPDFCLLFYYLSIFSFTLVVLAIFSLIALTFNKKMNFILFVQMIWVVSLYILVYFQNRVLYSMCTKSI
jgi:hypothetical protein